MSNNRTIKVLNLYSGIGGNRKLWKNVEVTAIENNHKIVTIYKEFFPDDLVIVTDAHQYLLNHYKEFDFIWSSPPCPSHSRIRKQCSMNRSNSKAIYPDMKLYEEILLLQGYFKGKWAIENVISWYQPLIKAQEIGRHYFWSNFIIPKKRFQIEGITKSANESRPVERIRLGEIHGFDLSEYKGIDKRMLLRNCILPEMGLYVLKCAFKIRQKGVSDYEK